MKKVFALTFALTLLSNALPVKAFDDESKTLSMVTGGLAVPIGASVAAAGAGAGPAGAVTIIGGVIMLFASVFPTDGRRNNVELDQVKIQKGIIKLKRELLTFFQNPNRSSPLLDKAFEYIRTNHPEFAHFSDFELAQELNANIAISKNTP